MCERKKCQIKQNIENQLSNKFMTKNVDGFDDETIRFETFGIIPSQKSWRILDLEPSWR